MVGFAWSATACGRSTGDDSVAGPSATPEPSGEPVAVVPVPVPQPTQLPNPQPVPAPNPAPGEPQTPTAPPPSGGGSGAFAYVRVGFFGFDCPNGVAKPRNNERKLPVGCRGFVTATPKYQDGSDVPFDVHGPGIRWSLPSGSGVVSVLNPIFPNDFNRDLQGRSPGRFSFCATVQGVTGCLDGNVVPAS